jgi:hypothetical protein
MIEKPTEKCVRLLNDVFFFEGKFNYDVAKTRLELWLHIEKSIDAETYLNFLDALNHRQDDGHYRNSLIYKRAESQEGVGELDLRDSQS